MHSVFQFLCLPCCASCNFTQKPWLKISGLTALFPFFYLFSLDIRIFYIYHTCFSVFALIICSLYSLVSGFRSSKILSIFLLTKHQMHTIRETKRNFLLASEAFQRTRVLRDLGSLGIQSWLGESISDCCACRVHTDPAHPMTLDTGCLV